jgi:hypothetical protein
MIDKPAQPQPTQDYSRAISDNVFLKSDYDAAEDSACSPITSSVARTLWQYFSLTYQSHLPDSP